MYTANQNVDFCLNQINYHMYHLLSLHKTLNPQIVYVFLLRFQRNTYLRKTNTQIAKDLKITSILDKLLEYKRN